MPESDSHNNCPEISAADFQRIFRILKQQRGLDFSAYRPGLPEKRIRSHLRNRGLSTHGLLQQLCCDPQAVNALLESLSVNVSGFFRDPLVFEYLAHRVLPALVFSKKSASRPVIRIWSAGCATGEEPYSVAIALREILGADFDKWRVHLFATSMDDTSIEVAKKGVYKYESVRDVRLGLVRNWFTKISEEFAVKPEIKNMVEFSVHNILDPRHYVPPESVYGHFDLVLCRNLLLYFNAGAQKNIFNRLHKALAPGGYLVLGLAEQPPAEFLPRLKTVSRTGHIYQKARGAPH